MHSSFYALIMIPHFLAPSLDQSLHQADLRPSLGHPQRTSELEELCKKENLRREDSIASLERHTSQQQEATDKQGQSFVSKLASVSEALLLQFDNMITVDDVVKGRVPSIKQPTSELLRRRLAGAPLEDDEDKNKLPRGKKTWPGGCSQSEIIPLFVIYQQGASHI